MDQVTPNDGRRSRKRQRTADHIAAVAFDLFTRHGFAVVTMEQIAAAADVAKGTLYNHFPVKEAVLCHRMHQDLAEALPGLFAALPPGLPCAERLRGLLRASAEYTVRNRELVPYYIQYRLSRPFPDQEEHRSGSEQIYRRLIADGQEAGEISRAHDSATLARMLQFLHLATVFRWVQAPETDLFAGFAEMVDLFLHGCAEGGRT